MNAKHTAGPLAAGKPDITGAISIYKPGEPCQPLGYLWGHVKESPANAALFIAAPDLLAALIGAQASLRKALTFLPPDDEAINAGEWLDEIAEVIAKATGAEVSQ